MITVITILRFLNSVVFFFRVIYPLFCFALVVSWIRSDLVACYVE